MKHGNAETPKALLRTDRRQTVLDHPLELLRDADVQKTIFATSIIDVDLIRKHLRESCDTATFHCSVQDFPDGIVQAVSQALEESGSPNQSFFLFHGDEIVRPLSIRSVYYQHLRTFAPITEVLTNHPAAGNNYVMWTDKETFQVKRVVRHSFVPRSGSVYTGTGIFLFSPGVFQNYRDCPSWQSLIFSACKRDELFGYLTDCEFFNLNTPRELAYARARLSFES
jgi:NDP-sugar pyrophosphorylase family protein